MSHYVLGIDGCRTGWLVVKRHLANETIEAHIFPDFGSLLAGPGKAAAGAVVDMPIGLAETGRRACEAMARRMIGPRRSSVFSAPRRPMLAFDTYADANAWGKAQGPSAGGGLSKQAWMITPKIREIDAAISPSMQARMVEGHPEAAFTRLGGAPCRHAKRTSAGAAERLAVLKKHGIDARALIVQLRRDFPLKRHFADDDLIDACALSLTAQARLHNKAARLTDGARDRRGLRMEIWG